MKTTPDLFAAYLKCPTKCWLRAQGETAPGNEYAEWVRTRTESYRSEGVKRLLESVSESERHPALSAAENPDPISSGNAPGRDGAPRRPPPPGPVNAAQLKTAQWRLATDLPVHTENLESCLHAVERIPSEGRGKPAQFIPIRFIFTNKLTKDDRLLLAFDALVLSEAFGREASLGKIIHGDDHATRKVKTRR